MTAPLLQVENISVHYGRLAAVRGVSLLVGRGEIVCLVGPNGAGKSTTLLTIAGVLSPSQGTVRFDALPTAQLSPEAVARLGISMVPEGRRVFSSLTVEENLRLGTYGRNDKHAVESELTRIYDEFPILAERRSMRAAKLSGGEQQQLAISRALLTGAKLLLVDEPSLGLAPIVVERVYDILRDIREKRGVTLLIVEESTERAVDVADRVYVLRRGLIELEGSSEELADGERLHEAYFGFGAAGSSQEAQQ
jgi:branched-chain amino acid transport system ATP-binding protein